MKKIIQKSKKIIAVVSMCLICATTFAGEAVMLNADVNNSQKTESIVNFAANDIPFGLKRRFRWRCGWHTGR